MTWVNAIVVFICVWWVVLFMVLPWGVRPLEKPEPGQEQGAPERPMMWRKALITTLISIVVWLAIYIVVQMNVISFHDMVNF